MITELTPNETERFYSKVQRGDDGCWLWVGEANNKGYGRFAIYRKDRRFRLLAHRVAFYLATGASPVGSVLRHSCDNPPCCNPSHLMPGTQAENMRDAALRGRVDRTGLDDFRAMAAASVRRRMRIGQKVCRQCRQLKPFGEFFANAHNADGRQYDCKTCYTAIQRDYVSRKRSGGLSERERRRLKRRVQS